MKPDFCSVSTGRTMAQNIKEILLRSLEILVSVFIIIFSIRNGNEAMLVKAISSKSKLGSLAKEKDRKESAI